MIRGGWMLKKFFWVFMRIRWVFDKRFWFFMRFGWLLEKGFLIFELKVGGCKINDFWVLVKGG
jgi:hypothetical protein